MAEMRASGKDKAPYDVLMFNEIWSAQMRREGYMLPLTPAMIPNLDNAMMQVKDPTTATFWALSASSSPPGWGTAPIFCPILQNPGKICGTPNTRGRSVCTP